MSKKNKLKNKITNMSYTKEESIAHYALKDFLNVYQDDIIELFKNNPSNEIYLSSHEFKPMSLNAYLNVICSDDELWFVVSKVRFTKQNLRNIYDKKGITGIKSELLALKAVDIKAA